MEDNSPPGQTSTPSGKNQGAGKASAGGETQPAMPANAQALAQAALRMHAVQRAYEAFQDGRPDSYSKLRTQGDPAAVAAFVNLVLPSETEEERRANFCRAIARLQHAPLTDENDQPMRLRRQTARGPVSPKRRVVTRASRRRKLLRILADTQPGPQRPGAPQGSGQPAPPKR